MKRSDFNFIVDAFAFIGLVALIITGLVMRFVLPPFRGGRGGETAHSMLWGLDRHQWGEVHFWIVVSLLAILTIHLFLHWKWIASVVQGKPGEGSGIRATLGMVSLIVLLAAAVLPFLSPIEHKTHSGKPGIPGKQQVLPKLDEAGPLAKEEPYEDAVTKKAHPGDIRGSMTLQEVEDATGVPSGYILEKLGLPEDTSPQEKLGRLRKEFGFSIQEVRDIVENYQE